MTSPKDSFMLNHLLTKAGIEKKVSDSKTRRLHCTLSPWSSGEVTLYSSRP